MTAFWDQAGRGRFTPPTKPPDRLKAQRGPLHHDEKRDHLEQLQALQRYLQQLQSTKTRLPKNEIADKLFEITTLHHYPKFQRYLRKGFMDLGKT